MCYTETQSTVRTLESTIDERNAMICALLSELTSATSVHYTTNFITNAEKNGSITGIQHLWSKHQAEDIRRVAKYTKADWKKASVHEKNLAKRLKENNEPTNPR
jgi:hypothetical protein